MKAPPHYERPASPSSRLLAGVGTEAHACTQQASQAPLLRRSLHAASSASVIVREALKCNSSVAKAPIRVLIVEDEAIVALDLQQQLEELGYQIVGTAESGDEAVQLARQHRPALALMDVIIKGPIDGIETAGFITRLGVPVIFLTSFSDPQTVERAAELGPHGYLTKPFQTKELRATIEVALTKAAMERQLAESEHWLASTLRCVADAVIVTESDGRIRYINPAAEALCGWARADAAGRPMVDVFHLEKVPAAGDSVHRLRRHDGTIVMVEKSHSDLGDESGYAFGTVRVLRDVTERLRQEKRLQESEERFRSAFDHAPVGMALAALDGRFMQVNDALCRLLGYTAAELLEMRQECLTHAQDLEPERMALADLTSGAQRIVQFEKRFQHKNGRRLLWTLTSVSALHVGTLPQCYLYQIQDVTERKDHEMQLTKLAYLDALTGLGNRMRLGTDLERSIATARRTQKQMAVLYMDLDQFKPVNDRLGHEAGDLLLQEIAKRLTRTLRESDCVARVGGDEFVMILNGLAGHEQALGVVEKLRLAVSQPISLPAQDVQVTPSIGVSLFPADGDDPQTLLRCADSALYDAKSSGRNRFSYFRAELAFRADERIGLELALSKALERSELSLEYQPIMDLADGSLRGLEALVRWTNPHATDGTADFVPVAEATGMIGPIGSWVLRQACLAAAKWPTKISLHVNCSLLQFRDDGLADTVGEALSHSGLAPERLCLEIGERVLQQRDSGQFDRAKRLKALGVRLAVDDYGRGWSPVAQLQRFAPDFLKLESSLTRSVDRDKNSSALVAATLAMAHQFGCQVIAVGVENPAQAEHLKAFGCDQAQGFLYRRPMPCETVQELFGATSRAP